MQAGCQGFESPRLHGNSGRSFEKSGSSRSFLFSLEESPLLERLLDFWNRIVAADPGLARLATAARVTLSVALASLVLAAFAAATGAPITVAVLGAVVAMQASLAVNDPQARTTVILVPLPGALGLILGALTSGRSLVTDGAFLAVVFAAVWIRRFGARWTAFGTVTTMTYFFALFFDAKVEQIPALLVTVTAGAAVTYLVRFVLLPDRAGWIAHRMVDAFRARLRVLVTEAADTAAGRVDHERAIRILGESQLRANETAVAIEGRLGADAGEHVRTVMDAELAAENLASAVLALHATGEAVPRALRLALSAMSRGRYERARRVAALLRDDPASHEDVRAAGGALEDLAAALDRLDAVSAALAERPAPAPPAMQQQPALQQAIQVTVAAGASIAAGELISPQRWYWAVLATYFVFIGTASSGETRTKAWARTLGTAFGVAAGLVAGHLAAGRPQLDVGLVFVCLFAGVYFLRVSYGAMIFFITALLALLYALLGRFSLELLVVRLAETAIGTIFGAAAATLLFPTRTRDVVRDAAADALDGAADVVEAAIARLTDPASEVDPVDASLRLDQRVQNLVARAAPLSAATITGAHQGPRRWIVGVNAGAYYARNLARLADRTASRQRGDEGVLEARARDTVERLRASAQAVRAGQTPALGPPERGREIETGDERASAAGRLLAQLDRSVASLPPAW